MKRVFRVDGMRCAACQAHVQAAVAALDGVKKADVNLPAKELTVEYDDTVLQAERIILEVSRLGFKASLVEDEQETDPAEEAKKKVHPSCAISLSA